MPLVKAAKPKDIFAPDEWAAITHVSPWRGLWLTVHAWLIVFGAAWGTALLWEWNFLAGLIAAPIAIAIIGGRQLGLSILMHDAAHGHLHPNRKLNNFLGQFTGAATGSDLHAYRAYHLTHHKYTQQPEDPDLGLSAPFPTTRASLRRKVIRDLTAQTFFKQRSHQFAKAWQGFKAILRGESDAPGAARDTSAGRALNNSGRSGVDAPVETIDGAKVTARTIGRFLAIQIAVLITSLLTVGILPFLLWLIALATTFQLFLRIRNIAEHACTTTGSEDPFSHARTTRANFLERLTVAPYWVNYHSEHHLFMGVPCYHLERAHEFLGKGGYHQKMTIEPGYRAVLKLATA